MAEEIVSDVVINEVMVSNKSFVVDENGDTEDWIELYNNSSQSVLINGYYLTDDASEMTQWAFPDVTIAANGFLMLWTDSDDEEGLYHTNFKLSSDGEELLLVTLEMKIADQVFFTNQFSDVSYARWSNGTGDFVLLAPTYDRSNDTYLSLEESGSDDFLVYSILCDVLNIKTNELIKGLELYSISGHRIDVLNNTNYSIYMSTLSDAVYLLRIDMGDSFVFKRIVKM